jgi:D-xylose transport system substrate-binding protein
MLSRIRIALILLGILAFAPSTFAQQAIAPQTAAKPIRIGYSLDSLRIERWQTDVAEFQKRAQQLGASVQVENADGDENTQFKQAQKLINSGIQVLVIVPHNTDTASKIVEAAKVRNVKVISYDRLILHTADIDAFVGFDNTAIGAMQAESLVQRAPKGNYVLIEGSPTDDNAQLFYKGQMSVLQPYIARGDIKIVSESWAADWSPAEAYLHMTEALDHSKDDVVAVVAANDGTAGGAIQALQEHHLAGKVFVSGQDADLAGVLRILDDTQTMTVLKPIRLEADRAAEIAVGLATGQKVATGRTVENGSANIPAVLLDSVLVTKNNVKQTVIQSGFQSAELVKQNLPKDKWNLVE